MSHQHCEVLLVPRGDVGLQRHQIKVEPLNETLACIVLRISHRLHVVLREKWTSWRERIHGRVKKADGAIVEKQIPTSTHFGCAA